MGLFDRFRRTRRPGVTRGSTSHQGVEAFVEPRTTVTETTVVLVAHDGEWTRRRIGDEQAAFRLGHKLGIPVYEISKVGYPKRMREYTARLRAQSRRQDAD